MVIGIWDYQVFPYSKSLQEIASEQGAFDDEPSKAERDIRLSRLAEDWRYAAKQDWESGVRLYNYPGSVKGQKFQQPGSVR